MFSFPQIIEPCLLNDAIRISANPIERINREFKKRSRPMGTLGEGTLESLLAFTALRLEMGWRQVPVDSPKLAKLKYMRDKTNALEDTVSELIH